MAGTVQQPRQAPQYDKPNSVLKVAPVETRCVVFTNSEGRKSMCLVLIFGKDVDDGGPGVYVFADEQQMTDTLKIASKLVRDGVRRELSKAEGVKGENIPVSVLGEGPLHTGVGFDATQVEIGGKE
jgi:hypothetical protein